MADEQTVVDQAAAADETTILGAETPEDKAAAEQAASDKAAQDKAAADKAEALKNETPEQKAEREKVEQAEKVANSVPEKYEFKVPEGMEVDTALVDKLSPIFKEIKLTQGQAQKLVDAYAPHIKAQVEATQKASIDTFKSMVEEWKTDTTKELGADSAKKIALAGKAINKFGTPELRTLLNETGVGNHKELVNFFVKVGTLLSEDHIAEPNKQTTGDINDLSTLYDHPTSQGLKK